MAKNKLANLQNALKSSSGKSATSPVSVAAQPPSAPVRTPPKATDTRANKVNISAWLHKDFKKSIRLVQAKKSDNTELQNLMAEAFNELFAKYNVPTVNQD